MKRFLPALLTLCAISAFAVEVDVDGKFENFWQRWSTTTRRMGTVEPFFYNGENIIQLASEPWRGGKVGIYTGRGFYGTRGDVIAVEVDTRGGELVISLMEYCPGRAPVIQSRSCPATEKRVTRHVKFTVKEPDTQLVRVSFSTEKGSVALITNVRVDARYKKGNEK